MRDETVEKMQPRRGVPDDAVSVEPMPGGWYHVQIVRGPRVKRFNLREAEAGQLTAILARDYGIQPAG